MHIFVKEVLYLLDYNDNILDTLFVSTDKRTPGYAYEINIQDHNTGHSDLSFRMPCDIINKDGEKVKNPKLTLIKSLSKVRYNRQITYTGKETITIPGPGDVVETYPKNNGENPEDYIIEDYTMDYIVQPLDKSRQNIGIGLTYTAIDFPRFNLSKKKLGLTFDEKTITSKELSLYKNTPLNIPGKVKYIPWTKDLVIQYQCSDTVTNQNILFSLNSQEGDIVFVSDENALYQKQKNGDWINLDDESIDLTKWEPNPQKGRYPLDDNAIKKLVKETHFPDGILSTIYYWPVTKTGRFEGVRYEKDGFITLSLYNVYKDLDIEKSDYLNEITWDWNFLYPIEHYLLPNNACNYLRYILKDTNWKVKGDKNNFIKNTDEHPWFNYGSPLETNLSLSHYIKNNVSTVTSGTGLYHHTSDLSNSANDDSYRYAGANPNNWIRFNNEDYRIIGVFGDKIKLIKNDYIATETPWDTDNSNNWDKPSSLNTYLNNEWINTLGDSVDLIQEHQWEIGTNNGVLKGTPQESYLNEIVNIETSELYSNKIGLIYINDYGFSVPSEAWIKTLGYDNYNNRENSYDSTLSDGTKICDNSWLFDSNLWTITKSGSSSEDVMMVAGQDFMVGSGIVKTQRADGASRTYHIGTVKPCFYLKSNIKYISGDGSQTNPFIIGLPEEGEEINVPIIGEEGQYYITIEDLENNDYNAYVYRKEKGEWTDKTDDTMAQIVNMDKNDPDLGTLYDIDIEQVKVTRSKEESIGQSILMNARYNLKVNNSNCYNAITSEAKLFDLYPIFDCINKTVSLKLNVGKNYGLTYKFKSNLKSSNVKVDGEKVITKLYVTGGQDANGSRNINIGEATRSIIGEAPTLQSKSAKQYNITDLNPEIQRLEKNVYENLKGIPLENNINMSDQTFKLDIPDNLYEMKYTKNQLEGSASLGGTLYEFNANNITNKIKLLYNPTGADHCFYIYEWVPTQTGDENITGDNSYKDENKQLYKFDFSNMTLRRNLKEINLSDIGIVNNINTNERTRSEYGNIPIVNYIKYKPDLDENIAKDDNFYKGNVLQEFNDGNYIFDNINNEEFVLTGPDRIYNIPINEEKTYNYSVGNYYFRERDGKYLYCAKQNIDSKSIYSKVNTISINGYVFIVLGNKNDNLNIRLNEKSEHQLIPYPYSMSSGIYDDMKIDIQNDGSLIFNGISPSTIVFGLDGDNRITLKANKDYIFKCECNSNNVELVAAIDKNVVLEDGTESTLIMVNSSSPIKIHVVEDSTITLLSATVMIGTSLTNVIFKPMLYEGNSTTNLLPYEPYDKGVYNIYFANNDMVTLEDWFSNNFALRVKFDGTKIKEVDNFNPNNPEYLMKRTPYGESYIYNFKYLYDNNWITKEQVLDIYRVNQLINNLNLDFYDKYMQDLTDTKARLEDAINNQEIYSSKADAQLEALMSQYWKNPNKASDDQFSAFPGIPKGAILDNDRKMYKQTITYDKFNDNGNIITIPVKIIYFNVFNNCDNLYPSAKDNNTQANNPELEGQYHVVAKALGWNDNVNNVLTLNEELDDYTDAQDPSHTVENYNKFIKQMKEYYYKAYTAEENINKAEKDIKALDARYKEWQNQIEKYEKYLQENYGQYIIEGSYTNQEQPYANLLLNDGLDASDKYATPDITYNIGVVDSSGLIEYRSPQLYLCNQLIKRLHNIGQIAPHVGDYVAIQDEPMGMFGVPGLITSISRRVDNPYQNNITIDTSYSDADELVGNIITATNTILSNKDIYGRAAIINNKGELSTTTINKAMGNGKNAINIVSTNGKIEVNDNGLICTNPNLKDHKIKYNGTGILSSTDTGETWRELLTPYGINANYINAGAINSSKVSITNGEYDSVVLNGDGLTVKKEANKPYSLGALKSDGTLNKDDFTNVAVFIGKDKENKGIGYFEGYINANKGGNIGGWKILNNKLSSENGNIILSPNETDSGKVFKAGNNFSVDSTGRLYANGANITGNITANSLVLSSGIKIDDSNLKNSDNYLQKNKTVQGNGSSFSVDSNGKLYANSANLQGHIDAYDGTIGRFNLTQNKLYSGTGSTQAGMGVYGADYAFWAGSETSGTAPFHVGHDGALHATSAYIEGNGKFSGNITATSGTIGGCSISGGTLKIKNANISGNISCDKLKGGTISGQEIKLGDWTLKPNSNKKVLTFYNGSSHGLSLYRDSSGLHVGNGTSNACSNEKLIFDGRAGFYGGKSATITYWGHDEKWHTLTFVDGVCVNN